MRTRSLAGCLATVVAITGVRAQDDSSSKPSADPVRIEALVRDLGHEEPARRDRAMKELEAVGRPAAPALQKALESDDPEVQWRAEKLLRTIRDTGPSAPDRSGDPDETPGGGVLIRPRSGGGSQSFQFRFQGSLGEGGTVIQQSPDGVKVTVTRVEDGKRVTKVYEAKSSEEFREKYPEIAGQYGIGGGGAAAGRPPTAPRLLARPEPADPGPATEPETPEEFDQRVDRHFRDMEREMADVERWMRDSGGRNDSRLEEFLRRFNDRFGRMEPRGAESPSEDREPDPAENAEKEPGAPGTERPRAETPAPPAKPSARPAPREFGVRAKGMDPALAAQLGLDSADGAVITEIDPDSTAARLGLERHDIVRALNGTPVDSPWTLRRLAPSALSGEKVKIEILRQGKPLTLEKAAADLVK